MAIPMAIPILYDSGDIGSERIIIDHCPADGLLRSDGAKVVFYLSRRESTTR